MRDVRTMTSVEEMYGEPGTSDDDLYGRLDRSLLPRGPSMLYDTIGALGLSGRHRVLDVGCRDAAHACELVARFGCRVTAVDPVAHNVERARRLVTERGLGDAVEIHEASVESIPCADGSIDYVWCRDVLNHVRDLDAAFRECARVLSAGGAMVVFQTFATELLEPREATRLYAALATVAESMSASNLERAAVGAGLRVEMRDVIGSEWREHGEESENRRTSKQLLRIARMRRARETMIAEVGPVAFEIELADCQWGVYQMLGKLCPIVYVLRR